MINFIQVDAADIDDVWDDCIPMLEKSFDRLVNDYNVNDIYEQCKKEEMQLWIVMAGDKILACVVTIIIQHPARTVLNVVNLGGENLPQWAHLMDVNLTGFALANNCSVIRAWTRKGFSRIVPNFIEDGAIYVKVLKGAE